MIRKIAALFAASVLCSVSFTAVPARASEDLVKAMAGIAAIAIIGNAIAKDNETSAGTTAKSPASVEKDDTQLADSCDGAYWDGKRWVNDDGKPCVDSARTAQSQPTPAVCLRERWQDSRLIKYFDKPCMKNAGFELSIWRN